MDRAVQLRGNNFTRFIKNLAKDPTTAVRDGVLYLANKAGVPANATHYLRDLNVSIPYRSRAAIEGTIKGLYNSKSWTDNYQESLKEPTVFNDWFSIEPLISDNSAFNKEELSKIKEAAGTKSRITARDIKRVTEDGTYGSTKTPLKGYFTPAKVI